MENQDLQDAFPQVECGIEPLGSRMLVQLLQVRTKSRGGILLVDETKDTERVQTMIGKVIAVGPLAFKNRDTGEDWTEGVWLKPGDYLRTPRFSGDRFTVPHPTEENEHVQFQILNDFEAWGRVKPEYVLSIKQFV